MLFCSLTSPRQQQQFLIANLLPNVIQLHGHLHTLLPPPSLPAVQTTTTCLSQPANDLLTSTDSSHLPSLSITAQELPLSAEVSTPLPRASTPCRTSTPSRTSTTLALLPPHARRNSKTPTHPATTRNQSSHSLSPAHSNLAFACVTSACTVAQIPPCNAATPRDPPAATLLPARSHQNLPPSSTASVTPTQPMHPTSRCLLSPPKRLSQQHRPRSSLATAATTSPHATAKAGPWVGHPMMPARLAW